MTDSNSNTPTEPVQDSATNEDELQDLEPFERRSAQAMVATYLQMTRYAEFAQTLHKARLRSTELRMARAEDLGEVERLQRQIGAQQSQGESIDLALGRFRRHAGNLKSFTDAGLTREDFEILGIDELLGEPDPNEDPAERPGGEETH